MPDWIAHIAFAFIISVILGFKENRSLMSLGAVLPDAFRLFIPFQPLAGFYGAINFFSPLHTLSGILLSSALVSSFFKPVPWRHAFALILLGATSHLFLDSLLFPYGKFYWFLWPLWTGFVGYGLIWPDSYLPTIILGSMGLITWRYWGR